MAKVKKGTLVGKYDTTNMGRPTNKKVAELKHDKSAHREVFMGDKGDTVL